MYDSENENNRRPLRKRQPPLAPIQDTVAGENSLLNANPKRSLKEEEIKEDDLISDDADVAATSLQRRSQRQRKPAKN